MKQACYLIFLGLICSQAAAQTNGDIKLVDGIYTYSGRLEIYLNNQWNTVCYRNTPGLAQVACRQLGYSGYDSMNTVKYMNVNPGSGTILSSAINCDSNSDQQHILRCTSFIPSDSCQHTDDMAIICSSSSISPYDTAVRLVDGGTGYLSSGIAEVYLNDQWGAMCDYEIADNEASTICRQLGYTSSSGHTSTLSSTKVWLDDVDCGSSSSCLNLCFPYPSTSYTVTCTYVAVVNCTFDEENEDIYSSGSESLCTGYLHIARNLVAIIVGVLVVLFVVCLLFILLPIIICCCCIPGCILHSCRERRVVYQVIQ